MRRLRLKLGSSQHKRKEEHGKRHEVLKPCLSSGHEMGNASNTFDGQTKPHDRLHRPSKIDVHDDGESDRQQHRSSDLPLHVNLLPYGAQCLGRNRQTSEGRTKDVRHTVRRDRRGHGQAGVRADLVSLLLARCTPSPRYQTPTSCKHAGCKTPRRNEQAKMPPDDEGKGMPR